LEAGIAAIAPDAQVIAGLADRLPNTSLVVMPGVASDSQVMAFDLAGICVSAGSACASGKAKASSVLTAMGVHPDLAKGAVRVSLGHANTTKEIESFLSVWKDLYVRSSAKRSAA
jgi:cysteine desulfurase